MEGTETESNNDDFGGNYINRSAISLKPLQPFINWHDTIYPDSKFDELTFNEVNIYLTIVIMKISKPI